MSEPIEPPLADSSFRKELEHLINCYSRENGSDTPDFILADYLCGCLEAFDRATNRRDRWYGDPVRRLTGPTKRGRRQGECK
jgi:hypothetical protein